MKCIFCGNSETKVVDSRESEELTRRRRECLNCKKRFTTYESAEAPQVYIIKKDGRREPFEREKIKRGILRACEKRDIPLEKIEEIINKIETKLRLLDTNEIQSKVLGHEVAKLLKQLDKVAYIRFASLYREFEDLGDFKKEIRILTKKGG